MIVKMIEDEFNKNGLGKLDDNNKIRKTISATLAIRKSTKNRLIRFLQTKYPRPVLIDFVSQIIDESLDKQGAPK